MENIVRASVRTSMQVVESEREGGLLSRAGFTLTTVNIDVNVYVCLGTVLVSAIFEIYGRK